MNRLLTIGTAMLLSPAAYASGSPLSGPGMFLFEFLVTPAYWIIAAMIVVGLIALGVRSSKKKDDD